MRKYWIPLVGILTVAFGGLALVLTVGYRPQLGLDLQGGASVVLQPADPVPTDVLDEAIEIVRNRVDALGVAEPDISRQGDSVLVELPGVRDQQRALDLVGQTAELRFRPALAVLPGDEETPVPTVPAPEEATEGTAPADTSDVTATPEGGTTVPPDTATTVAPAGDALGAPVGEGGRAAPRQADTTATTATTVPEEGATTTTVGEPSGEVIPTTPREEDVAEAVVVLPELDGDDNVVVRYQLGPAALTGSGISSARAAFDQSTGQWLVLVEFNDAGIDAFNDLAAACFQAADPTVCPTGQIAITLDGVVQSAPTVQAPEFDRDQVQISGAFTEGDAKDLALVLRYGALPVQLEPQTVQTVSATLGNDSLRAVLVAGGVGILLVIVYLTFYYRLLGLLVLGALATSGALLFTIISVLGETRGLALTLAGIVGIVVSIGVTVDSSIVFMERLKEDVRAGKSLRSSVDRGFSAAYRTIVSADIASLIGAGLLYWLTVGSVRGFAFFLGLATLIDLVVAWFYTRPAVAILARTRRFSGSHVLGVDEGESLPGKALVGAGR